MAKAAQLDLFASADELRQLQAENAWLKTRLENTKTEFRKLREERQQYQAAMQEYERLQRELERTKQDLTFWRGQARLYEIAEMARQWQQPQLAAPSKAEVTKLLTCCHPGRWAQGQSATELAHEVTIQLNAWRERIGVQP